MPEKFTICSPDNFTDALSHEVYSFECTPAVGADYSLSFEDGKKGLVCRPVEEDIHLRHALKEAQK